MLVATTATVPRLLRVVVADPHLEAYAVALHGVVLHGRLTVVIDTLLLPVHLARARIQGATLGPLPLLLVAVVVHPLVARLLAVSSHPLLRVLL